MIKFSKKIQLIKESNNNPIAKLCDDYEEKLKNVNIEYRTKFISTIEKILMSYYKYVEEDINMMDNGDEDFQCNGTMIYRIIFDDRGIVLEGEEYKGDQEFEVSLELKNIYTDFASEFLREISEREYIIKYFKSDLNYGALKKINN